MATIECYICVENVLQEKIFSCNICKYKNCIDCHKKYLLTSVNDPHCINCRTVIPFNNFINKFNEKNWIFTKYKVHKENILMEKEKNLLKVTIRYMSIQNEIKKLVAFKMEKIKEIRNIDSQIDQLNITSKIKNPKIKYKFSCPKETCKGYLNEEYICDLCDINVCKKCYIEMKDETHECDEALVETFNLIKKEAKPCPSCGEFISKISGCDQMFCVSCGNAFSWKTGLIEKGIIHNPHAHAFFQNNAGAQQNYLNALNGNGADVCRTPLPNIVTMHILYEKIKEMDSTNYIKSIYRCIAEFRQYKRATYLNVLNNNEDINNDLRIRFINNELCEKKLKTTLHSRDKKRYFKKELCHNIISTFEISELLIWAICDSLNEGNFIDVFYKNVELLANLRIDANNNIAELCDKFKFKNTYDIGAKYESKYYI